MGLASLGVLLGAAMVVEDRKLGSPFNKPHLEDASGGGGGGSGGGSDGSGGSDGTLCSVPSLPLTVPAPEVAEDAQGTDVSISGSGDGNSVLGAVAIVGATAAAPAALVGATAAGDGAGGSSPAASCSSSNEDDEHDER